MDWTKTCIKAVKNMFAATEEVLGTEEAMEPLGKNPKGDITYKIDKVAEKAILGALPEDVSVVSEESGNVEKDSDFVVFVDPVCGSDMAKRGSRIFSTGIAVYTKEMKPVCEAIGLMDTKDIYHADEKGAFRNSKTINVSPVRHIEDANVFLEIYHPAERKAIAKTKLFSIKNNVFKIPGKAVFCLIASGAVDVHAAVGRTYPPTELIGAYLIRQAGGIVTDEKGKQLKIVPDMNHRSGLLCVSTKELHKELLSLL